MVYRTCPLADRAVLVCRRSASPTHLGMAFAWGGLAWQSVEELRPHGSPGRREQQSRRIVSAMRGAQLPASAGLETATPRPPTAYGLPRVPGSAVWSGSSSGRAPLFATPHRLDLPVLPVE